MRNLLLILITVSLGACSASNRVSPTPSPETLSERLERDVRVLSEQYRDRNAENRIVLNASGDWIERRLRSLGYDVYREPVPTLGAPKAFNVVAELPGTSDPDEIVVIGAHYDAVPGSPGADDNASGVAVLLEIAARFVDTPQQRTVRWVAFTNEETPSSRGGQMGSATHARGCKERGEDIAAMVTLEMLGYFDEAPGSQRYPFPPALAERLGMTLPDSGDFVGVVGRLEDAELVAQVTTAMRSAQTIRVVDAALPSMIRDIWRSDHGPFWAQGYTAVMVTDTSEFRTPHYHTERDTAETLDFEKMGAAADACDAMVRALGRVSP